MKRVTHKDVIVPVCLDDHPGHDVDFYDGVARFLHSRRFRTLGDVRMVTPGWSKALARNVVFRCFCDASGTVMVAAYEIATSWFRRFLLALGGVKAGRVVEFRLGMADGRTLVLANIEYPGSFRAHLQKAGITVESLPRDTPVQELYVRWEELVSGLKLVNGEAGLHRLDTLERQRALMDFEEENGMRVIRGKAPLTLDEFRSEGEFVLAATGVKDIRL